MIPEAAVDNEPVTITNSLEARKADEYVPHFVVDPWTGRVQPTSNDEATK